MQAKWIIGTAITTLLFGCFAEPSTSANTKQNTIQGEVSAKKVVNFSVSTEEGQTIAQGQTDSLGKFSVAIDDSVSGNLLIQTSNDSLNYQGLVDSADLADGQAFVALNKKGTIALGLLKKEKKFSEIKSTEWLSKANELPDSVGGVIISIESYSDSLWTQDSAIQVKSNDSGSIIIDPIQSDSTFILKNNKSDSSQADSSNNLL